MATEHLTVEREGHTLVVTMNRPEAKNALSPPMLVGMADAWVEVDEDDDIRCAVLTGAGGAFCSGMDLKAGARRSEGDGAAEPNPFAERFAADPDLHWKALLRHYHLKKPLIAAVEGFAVAGGTEILQATDIRVAGEGATFGVFEAKRGLFPLGGSTVRLRRQIPYTVAMDLLLTGRVIAADEAQRIGLIGRVVADGQALAEAKQIAAQIAANGPLAVQAIKHSVIESEGLTEDEGLERGLAIGWPIRSTEEAKKSPRASLRGRLDILVNNAGIFPIIPFFEGDDELWRKTLDVNVMGSMRCTRAAAPHMAKSGGGAVVNLASIAGLHPEGDMPHYETSKGGVVMMTRSLAWELKELSIRVNAVAPGGIQTPGARLSIEPLLSDPKKLMARSKSFMSRLPLKRFGEPDDIARAVLFLATPMSSYMTGTLVLVDGGFL